MSTPDKPLFSESDLLSARKRLQDLGFPLTAPAAEIQALGAPEPFQTYVYSASEALRALIDESDSRRMIRAARRSADVVDRITKWIGELVPTGRGKPLKIACKAGCTYCCAIRVNALSAEIASIHDYVQARFSVDDKVELLNRVNAFVTRAAELKPRVRFLKPMLCPLNKDGLCTVYDVRPMACRSHHSFSVDQCRYSFDHWEEDHPVTRSAMRKACSDAAVMALVDTLEFCNLDSRALELPEAIQLALTASSSETERTDVNFDRAYLPEISEAADAPGLFKPSAQTMTTLRKKSR